MKLLNFLMKRADTEERKETAECSRGFVLMHEGIPCARVCMPTRRLTDQKNPHVYVGAWEKK